MDLVMRKIKRYKTVSQISKKDSSNQAPGESGKSLLSRCEVTIWIIQYHHYSNLFTWNWNGEPSALWESFSIIYYLKLIGNTPNSLRLHRSCSSRNDCLWCLALHSLRDTAAFGFGRLKNKMPDDKSWERFQIMRVVTVALGFLSRLVYFFLE